MTHRTASGPCVLTDGDASPPPATTWRCALIALLPSALVVALVGIVFAAGPRRFMPAWTDEVIYWNEAAVFAEAGFRGGYIVVHEQPARAGFSRFGPHGPVFAAFHGSLAWAFGWRSYSAFLVNIAVVSLAAFAWARGAPAGTSPPAILIIATFWPLLLYLPTNMQEPTHFAFALLFGLAIARDDHGGHPRLVWTAMLLIVSALLRPSWMLMLLPLGWRRARRRGFRAIALLLALTAGATAAAWGAFDFLAAPFPQNTRMLTRAWAESPVEAIAKVVENVSRNGRRYVGGSEESPQIVLRGFIALFVAVLGIRCVAARPRSSTHAETLETALLAILPVLAVVVLLADVGDWRDFRVLAPHLLVALLVLVAHAKWERWIWAVTLVLLPVYYNQFVTFHRSRFTSDRNEIAAMRDASSEAMPFVRGAPPWTNTLTVHADMLLFPLLGVSPGIGVSYVLDWSTLSTPVRSRYLLLRPDDVKQLASKVRLVPIAMTQLGMLYRNEGAPE